MSLSEIDPEVVSSLGEDGPLRLNAARRIGIYGTRNEVRYECISPPMTYPLGPY